MRRRVGSPNASVIADTAAGKVFPAVPPRAAGDMPGSLRPRMSLTSEQLVDALRPVEDPELHRSIVDLGMVRRAEWRADGTVSVLVALTVPGCPLRHEIQSRVDAALRPLEGVLHVELEFTVMSDSERGEVGVRLPGQR